MNKAIFEILRTGTHSASNGTTKFDEEDLADIARFYNEKIGIAPLVIGHPEDDQPQLGKAIEMYHHSGRLFATAEMSDELVQRIKNGDFSGISSAVYYPHHEQNPVQGLSCYIKHVGFLEKGKDEPAVQGMLDPQISVLLANLQSSNDVCFLSANKDGSESLFELNQKVLYLKNALGVEYCDALDIVENARKNK